MKKYDIIIIGFGPAGAYAAYRLSKDNKNLSIAIFEKGKKIEDRKCPIVEKKVKSCIKCNICSIMSGVLGAGAYSDAKYPITNDFGGHLWEKVGKEKSLELQYQVDSYNKEFYKKATGKDDFPKIYSSKNSFFKKICTQHNLHLLDADIRHLGTDIGQIVYKQIYKEISEHKNVDIYTLTEIKDIEKENNGYKIITASNDEYYTEKVIISAGRSGSKWVKNICKKLNIETKSNRIDLGIRFECPNEIWDHITKELYESKIIYKTKTYEDEVRTFCMNPSGLVVNENTNGGITVNGHAYEDNDKKTNNTNFALLVSKTFTEPFNDSNEYGEAIVKLSNMLGGGVIVQRYGDLIRGKRSTKERIKNNTVIPTLNAEPGDLSLVIPKRILDDIMEMILALDHLVPGMTNDDNLLYGVEVKFYDCIVNVNNNLEALPNLYIIGDGSGWTHSLSQSSASGLYIAEKILKV